MTSFLDSVAQSWMNALYERIKLPLDQFAKKNRPTRRLDWYHDEPRWLFRWSGYSDGERAPRGKKLVTQVEIRIEACQAVPSRFQLLLIAGTYKHDVGWTTELVDTLPLDELDSGKLESRLEAALKTAQSLDAIKRRSTRSVGP